MKVDILQGFGLFIMCFCASLIPYGILFDDGGLLVFGVVFTILSILILVVLFDLIPYTYEGKPNKRFISENIYRVICD